MDRRTFVSRMLIGIPVLPAAALAAAEPEVDWLYQSGVIVCPRCSMAMIQYWVGLKTIVEHYDSPLVECVNSGKKWELEKRALKRV